MKAIMVVFLRALAAFMLILPDRADPPFGRDVDLLSRAGAFACWWSLADMIAKDEASQ